MRLDVRACQYALGRAVLRVIVTDGFGDEDSKRILHNLGQELDGRVKLTIEAVDLIKLTPRGKAIYVDQRIERNCLRLTT